MINLPESKWRELAELLTKAGWNITMISDAIGTTTASLCIVVPNLPYLRTCVNGRLTYASSFRMFAELCVGVQHVNAITASLARKHLANFLGTSMLVVYANGLDDAMRLITGASPGQGIWSAYLHGIAGGELPPPSDHYKAEAEMRRLCLRKYRQYPEL